MFLVVATRLFGLIIFSMGACDVDGLATTWPSASAGAFWELLLGHNPINFWNEIKIAITLSFVQIFSCIAR